MRNVQAVDGGLLPGQAYHQVQVGFDHAIFGGLNGHTPHAIQFAASFLFGFLGHPRGVNAFF